MLSVLQIEGSLSQLCITASTSASSWHRSAMGLKGLLHTLALWRALQQVQLRALVRPLQMA